MCTEYEANLTVDLGRAIPRAPYRGVFRHSRITPTVAPLCWFHIHAPQPKRVKSPGFPPGSQEKHGKCPRPASQTSTILMPGKYGEDSGVLLAQLHLLGRRQPGRLGHIYKATDQPRPFRLTLRMYSKHFPHPQSYS